MTEPSLPYAGTSGWSGSATSKARAIDRAVTGKDATVQQRVLALLQAGGRVGVTVAEVRQAIPEEHHGTLSGALSNLHKDHRLARLAEQRDHCEVYVLPEHVDGRITKPHRSWRKGAAVQQLTSVPVEQIAPPEVRRDHYGRYLVVPPGGGKPIGYSRVTTVATATDDGGALGPWKATMACVGMAMRSGLRAQWDAILAEFGLTPWYDSPAGKAACKALVEDCAEVGGQHDRAQIGTALHTITALVDQGRTPVHLPDETEADVQRYLDGLAAAGVKVVPGMVELMTTLDRYEVAGTFDRLVTVPGFDLPLVADLKTGSTLNYSWQSIAVQMAAYSRGEAIYQQGLADDGSDDIRLPMPEVNQDWGLIMWLQPGGPPLELFLVDLNAGWEAFNLAVLVREWRSANPAMRLGDPIPTKDADLMDALAASLDRHIGADPGPFGDHDPLTHAEQIATLPMSNEMLIAVYRTALRDWLQERIDATGLIPNARQALMVSWPEGVPPLRLSDEHTFNDLSLIEQTLDVIDAAHGVPFPSPRPAEPDNLEDDALALVVDLFAGTTHQP